MAIVYADSAIEVARYAAGEPITDADIGDVIEGLQFQWQRWSQTVLAYAPVVPFETTSAGNTRVNDNTADYAEDLDIFPMFVEHRPDNSGNVELNVMVVGTLINAHVWVRDAAWAVVDTVTITLGAGINAGTAQLVIPVADLPCHIELGATRNGGAGIGSIFNILIHSDITSDAPR